MEKHLTFPAIKGGRISNTDNKAIKTVWFASAESNINVHSWDCPGNIIEVGMAGGRVSIEIRQQRDILPSQVEIEPKRYLGTNCGFRWLNAGWKSCAGNNFSSLNYIHPSTACMRETDVLHSCTEGITLFVIGGYHPSICNLTPWPWMGRAKGTNKLAPPLKMMTAEGWDRMQRISLKQKLWALD